MNQKLENAQKEIASKLGIGDDPTKEQMDLIKQINESLLQKIFYQTMEKLSESDREILLEKMDNETTSEEDVHTFLQSAVENYDGFVEETTVAFFAEMNDFIGDESKKSQD